jgi:hypothetical protein
MHIYKSQLSGIQGDVPYPKEILTALLILLTAHRVVGHRGIFTGFLAYKESYIWNGN